MFVNSISFVFKLKECHFHSFLMAAEGPDFKNQFSCNLFFGNTSDEAAA
jgi:hypothetical protein